MLDVSRSIEQHDSGVQSAPLTSCAPIRVIRESSSAAGTANWDFRRLTTELMDIEQRLKLFDQKVQGTLIWEYVRLALHHELSRLLGLLDLSQVRARPSLPVKLKRLTSAAMGSLVNHPLLSPRRQVLCLGYYRRLQHTDGRWWDIHLDPLLSRQPFTYLYLQRIDYGAPPAPLATSEVRNHGALDVVALVGRQIFRVSLSSTDRGQLQRIENALEATFGVCAGVTALVQRGLHLRQSLLPIYLRLLRRIQPRMVVVVSPNWAEIAMVEACRRLRIPTVEIQHGMIGADDPSYMFPAGAGKVRFFADHLLVYGDFWRGLLRRAPGNCQITSIGFPWLESNVKPYVHRPQAGRILLLSQTTVGAGLADFAIELTRQPGFSGTVVFRLHPDESDWRQRYPQLLGAPVVVESTTDQPLYKSMAQSECQIGVYSAALFEGLALGLPTYLVNLPGADQMEALVTRGWVKKVNTPQQLLADLTHGSPQESATPDRDSLFRPNSLSNMLEFFDSHL